MVYEEHVAARHAWDCKPVLRTVYDHLYRQIIAELAPGAILEVGGGASRLTEYRSNAIVSDLLPSPFVQLAADAQQLPFAAGSFDNIVLFDVLHHIPVPRRFFADAARVLRPEGRLIMMEPAITAGSYLFYRFLHPEPFDLSVDPLAEAALSSDAPYDANQAIPTLLATRDRSRLRQAFPQFKLTKSEWLSLLAYPMSGGLRPWSLLSANAAKRLLAMEDRMPAWLRRRLAFRIMLVMERQT